MITEYNYCENCGAKNEKGAVECCECHTRFKDKSVPPPASALIKKYLIPGAAACVALILLVIGIHVFGGRGGGTEPELVSAPAVKVTDTPSSASGSEMSEISTSAAEAEPTRPEDPLPKATDTPTPTPAPTEMPAVSQYLTEFTGDMRAEDPTRSLTEVPGTIRDNYGNYYRNAVKGMVSDVDNSKDYRIAGKYKWFFGRAVLNYDRRTEHHEDTFIYIYGDGRQLYRSKQIRNGVELQDIKLDVNGVDWLRIQIRGCNDIRLVDAVLSNEDDPEQFSTMIRYSNKRDYNPVPLNDLDFCNGSNSQLGLRYLTDTVTDNFGGSYQGGFAGTESDVENWVTYDFTDCGYTRITGRVVLNGQYAGTQSGDTYVKIYLDDSSVPAYTSNLVTMGMAPEDFSVDIRGVSRMRLSIQGRNYIRLVNCQVHR